MVTVDGHEYEIGMGANSPEELCMEFMKAMAQIGTWKQDSTGSKDPKKYVKLIVNGGDRPYTDSFEVEWPDVRINGLAPQFGKLSLRFTNLQKPSAKTQIIQSRAATVKADIAKLIKEAQAAGVDISDVLGNSAGEGEE